MATVQIQQETMALSNSAQRQALSCSSSAHLLPISEAVPTACGPCESPFAAPALQRCLSRALSRGPSWSRLGVCMARLESEGVEGVAPPAGPVTRESGPQGSVRPYTIVRDPAAWHAADWEGRESEWVLQLSAADVAAIEAQVAALQAAGASLAALKRPSDFPLPADLEARLAGMKRRLVHGAGFHLVRGLPSQRWSEWQNLAAYLGLGAHIGYRSPQSKRGNLVSHVKVAHTEDFGAAEMAAAREAAARGIQVRHGGPDGLGRNSHMKGHANNLDFDWHTDTQADVLGLLCISQAKAGGVSGWSSTLAVHNEMLRRGRGDLVACMAGRGWARDRAQYQELPPGHCPVWEMPVFHYHDGRLSVHFHAGQTRMCHARYPHLLGPLTPRQEEAMQLFTDIASERRFQFRAALRPGDALFLNNACVLHRRSPFEDGEAPHERRHLVRLWLAVDDGEGVPRAPHLDFPRSYTAGYDHDSHVGLLKAHPATFHVPRSDGRGNHC